MLFSTFPQTSFQDSRVDSGSVDLGTPLELSPKSPLEALDEALDAVCLESESDIHVLKSESVFEAEKSKSGINFNISR